MKIYKIYLILFFIVLGPDIKAQEEKLNPKIQELLDNWNSIDPVFKNALFSFSLRETESGKILLEHQANKSLTPASNLKLITTATAMEVLGEDFKFNTKIEFTGNIESNGTLNGDLFITGGGDPTLGSDKIKPNLNLNDFMNSIVASVKALGIKQIVGNIYADATLLPFNTTPDGWVWGDIGNYYGAASSGLNLNDNMFKIFFKPGAILATPANVVKVEPEVKNLQLKNMVLTGPDNSGDKVIVYGSPYSDFRYMTGTVPKNSELFAVKASLPDPAYFAAATLFNSITQAGISIQGKPKVWEFESSKKKLERKLIKSYPSLPLSEIIKETNLQSLNLYAEAIYKMVGLKFNQKFSYDSTANAVKSLWKINGINTGGLNMTDGCGLSFTNSMTANQLTYLLYFISQKPYFKSYFRSLPIAGTSGTLARLGKGTLAEGRIFAKTGTQTKVSCYSGYVKLKNEKLIAFSLMINNYEGKPNALSTRVEKLFVLLCGI